MGSINNTQAAVVIMHEQREKGGDAAKGEGPAMAGLREQKKEGRRESGAPILPPPSPSLGGRGRGAAVGARAHGAAGRAARPVEVWGEGGGRSEWQGSSAGLQGASARRRKQRGQAAAGWCRVFGCERARALYLSRHGTPTAPQAASKSSRARPPPSSSCQQHTRSASSRRRQPLSASRLKPSRRLLTRPAAEGKLRFCCVRR